MIILIDGYNLLRHIFSHVHGRLDAQKKLLITYLSCYKSQKVDSIREIVVVFDGGEFYYATCEMRHGVTVVYAGQQSSADQWIVEYVERHRQYEIVLISMDRKLRDACTKYGAIAMDVEEFYQILKTTYLIAQVSSEKEEQRHTELRKYEGKDEEQEPFTEWREVDRLMKEMSLNVPPKNESAKNQPSRSPFPAHRFSKKERKRLKILKKM